MTPPHVALQLTAPSEDHGYSGAGAVPGSVSVRAVGSERRS
jgi:hypothetical protein